MHRESVNLGVEVASAALCLAPTWTRAALAACAAVAASLAPGCTFEDHIRGDSGTWQSSGGGMPSGGAVSTGGAAGTGGAAPTGGAAGTGGAVTGCGPGSLDRCDPACGTSVELDAGLAITPVVRWRFDGDADTWLDSESPGHALQLNSSAETTGARYSKARLNGRGNSLYLDGAQFGKYAGSAGDALFPAADVSDSSPQQGFTISASFMMPPDWFAEVRGQASVWPIVSTMSQDSCGYQIDLRWESGDSVPKLAFSYGYRALDGGAGCDTSVIAYPLDIPASQWVMGYWHNVAGTYREDPMTHQAALRLYWNAVGAPDGVFEQDASAPPIDYSSHDFFVGTNATLAQTQKNQFRGYVDDIALFVPPLTDGQLANYAIESWTQPGPSQCRWCTWESWGSFALDASTAYWQDDSTPETAHVIVEDNDWGAGQLAAYLGSERDMTQYDRALLDATLTPDVDYSVALANDDGYCQWVFTGKDGRQVYSFDLAKPDNCSAVGCNFRLQKVSWFSLQTQWLNYNRSVDIKAHGLYFNRNDRELDWSTYGGATGPKGWCWRPQNFNPGGRAEWLNGVPSRSSVSVQLTGPKETTNRIAADFGDTPLALTGDACIEITFRSNIGANADHPLSFVLVDKVGSVRTWDIESGPVNEFRKCILSLGSTYSYDSGGKTHYEKFPSFDWSAIALLGIQKPYNRDTNKDGPVELTVARVEIHPGSGGCASYGMPDCRELP